MLNCCLFEIIITAEAQLRGSCQDDRVVMEDWVLFIFCILISFRITCKYKDGMMSYIRTRSIHNLIICVFFNFPPYLLVHYRCRILHYELQMGICKITMSNEDFWGGGSRHKSMFKVFEDTFTITSITRTVSKCY